MKKFTAYLMLFIPALLIITFFTGKDLLSNKAYSAVSDNVSDWAWSENIGWISTNCTDDTSCAGGSDYGVSVDSTTKNLDGYMWSENIGWISFNRSVTGAPPQEPFMTDSGTIAKFSSSDSKVTGWARALAGCQDDINVPVTVCSNTGDGLASQGWDGWIKLTDVTYNGTKFDGWAWGSDVVGWIDFSPFTNTPSGTIDAGGCTISNGSSSCTTNVKWASSDFVGAPVMLQGVTEFKRGVAVNAVGETRTVSPENNSFTLRDDGGTFIVSATANVTCEVGASWNSSTDLCEDVLALPLPSVPIINISVSPTLIRKGQVANVAVDVNSTDMLTCTIYGTENTNETFTHNGPANPTKTYSGFKTKALTSAQVVKVKCVVDAFPTVTAEKETRINVLSTGGEI